MNAPASASTGRRWLVAPFLVAAALAATAALADANTLARFLEHPLRSEVNGGTIAPTTIAGAHLLRWMLFGGAAAFVAGPLLLVRLGGAVPESTPDRRLGPGPAVAAIGALIAIATRIGESLWYDEIAPLLDYSVHGPGPIVGNLMDPSNHVAYSLATWGAATLLGAVDEITVRAPAALFVVVAVIAVGGLARQAGGRRVAALAAGAMAIMPIVVLEGANARAYSLVMAAAAASTWAALAAWSERRPALWTTYAVLIAVGTWGHLVFACVPAGHAIVFVAWGWRGERRALACAFVALAMGTAIGTMLLAPILPDLVALRQTARATSADQPGLVGPEGLHAIFMLGGAWNWWAALPGLAVAALGAGSAVRDVPRRRALMLSGAGLLAALVAVLATGSWIYARFLLFTAPAAALAIAFGLDALLARRATTGIAAAVLVGGAWIADLAVRPPRQPLRDAVELVHAARSPGDRIATIGLRNNVLRFYDPDIAASGPLGAEIAMTMERVRPAWVIVLYPELVPADRLAVLERAGLAPVARLEGWIDWGRGDVAVYGPPASATRIQVPSR